MLCGCVWTSEPVDQGPPDPAPRLVLLDLPDELLADVPQPEARGNTIGDAAILIEEQRAEIAGANDRLLAARRLQRCQRELIAGLRETCRS